MQVTVFGASGKVGRIVVHKLLQTNYSVVAFVHGSSPFENSPNLTVISGDIHNGEDIMKAVHGSGAVISCLGSWGTPTKDILTQGMSQIIPAMRQAGIKRIISLTGADARAKSDQLSLIHRISHLLLSIIGGKVLQDGENHIAQLEQSDLDWTVIRSPVMNEKGAQGFVLKPKRPMPWRTIHRYAVASSICGQLNDKQYTGQAPYIFRK